MHSEGPGSGSEFTVRLPLSSVARDTTPVPDRGRPAELATERLRVLIVEDDPDNRKMLRDLLELSGHQVEVAEDGVGGVEGAKAMQPDVAVVDIGLPGMDGYEVARRIRRDLGGAIRLIALTGYGQPEDRRRAAAAGFDAYLVKPVFADQLARALANERTRVEEPRGPS